MKTEIIQKDDPALRQKSSEIPIEKISGRETQTIIRRMQKALDKENDGIAIAAPQIGENVRIFVISKKIFDIEDGEAISKNETPGEQRDKRENHHLVFINPIITKQSKKKKLMEEGCLSVRWLYGLVERNEKVTVKAYNERGMPFSFGGSGIMAQVFQHEIDHLDGILFIDKARNLKDIPPNVVPEK
jgi:peptide deformylase